MYPEVYGLRTHKVYALSRKDGDSMRAFYERCFNSEEDYPLDEAQLHLHIIAFAHTLELERQKTERLESDIEELKAQFEVDKENLREQLQQAKAKAPWLHEK